MLYRKELGKNTNFRIEYFEYENSPTSATGKACYKLFVYENRDLVSGKFEVRDIEI
jgi:hypothetical protein